MPPRQKPEPDEPDLDELLDGVSDDELADLLERRKSTTKQGGGTSKGDRVTILEGKHASDWLKSFGIGGDDDDGGGEEPPRKRPGFFDTR